MSGVRMLRILQLGLLAACLGCNEVTVRGPVPDRSLVVISVVDGTARVPGAFMSITDPNGTTTRAGTTENGPYTASGPDGDWSIRLDPPPTHKIPATQPNPITVRVGRNETREVQFTLVRGMP
jgi:hypothetical protein